MAADSIVPPGMKLIDSATFIMGSQNGYANETPEHEVALSPYFVDSTEVTQLEYETLMKEKPWDNTTVQLPGGKGSYHPALGVNWYDAVYYCNARSKRDGLDTVYRYLAITGIPGDGCTLDSIMIDYAKTGYRLLTEAEWEYGYGTGKQTAYLWGETGDSAAYFAWFDDNSGSTSHLAAQKLPNLFGLYDMCGNVYEWLNDWYRSNYPQTIQINPTGPSSGSEKIHRGGAWNVRSDFLRITRRFSSTPSTRMGLLGFRVALPKR
jgi:formylglycine-generating enzyme required for sulfatase activity